MKITISENLKELAELLKRHGSLYIVGGHIRNAILGFEGTDIDLTAKITPEKMVEYLKGTKFEIIEKSYKMGTVKIACENEIWDYTTFRKDNYSSGGMHRPQNVDFIEDLRQDAQRRVQAVVPRGVDSDPDVCFRRRICKGGFRRRRQPARSAGVGASRGGRGRSGRIRRARSACAGARGRLARGGLYPDQRRQAGQSGAYGPMDLCGQGAAPFGRVEQTFFKSVRRRLSVRSPRRPCRDAQSHPQQRTPRSQGAAEEDADRSCAARF